MTSDTPAIATDLQYLNGFGNEHESEALAGALPIGRFSPQRVSYGLYAEQFNIWGHLCDPSQRLQLKSSRVVRGRRFRVSGG